MHIHAEISLHGLNLWWLAVRATALTGVTQTRPPTPVPAGGGSAPGAEAAARRSEEHRAGSAVHQEAEVCW